MASDMSEASSSASSPSPSDDSDHQAPQEPPTLEHLVSLFVSSKRALASTSSVWRANELVTASRGLLEEIAVLNAKTAFARGGVDEQLDTLHAIRDGISHADDVSADEFRTTIDRLDLANERLENTLNDLRNTNVDSSLSRTSAKKQHSDSQGNLNENEDEDDEDDDQPVRNLYHFIDENRHEDLRASLRNHIDAFNDARADLDESLERLDRSLQTVAHTLKSPASRSPAASKNPIENPGLYDDVPLSSIPQLFHGMEAHAAEMATLLQSLISHYDLSVTALKHTEGGGEAAARALAAAELPPNISTDPSGAATKTVEDSLYAPAPGDAGGTASSATGGMDPLERAQLLRVLENDALEVGDVVGEIRERLEAVEGQWNQLSLRASRARAAHAALREGYEMLREMQSVHLPSHLHALETFRGSWDVNRLGIGAKTEEVVALCDFNEAFIADYKKLLKEVERRRNAARLTRKVAEKAAKEIGKLESADDEARADFMEEVGRYLPTDLWPAMKDTPVRWEVRAFDPDT